MGLNFLDFCVIVPAAITIPLHLAIIMVILTNLRDKLIRNMYFMLVISQSITDVFCIICQIAFYVAPHIKAVSQFYWSLRSSSLPAWAFINIYFFLLARSIGIVLICLQRNLSIGYPFSYFNMLINSVPYVCVILFHFTLSILLPLPVVYYQRGFQFSNNALDYIMTPEILDTFTHSRTFGMIALITCSVIATIATLQSYYHAAKKPSRGFRMKHEICILRVSTIYLICYIAMSCYMCAMNTMYPLKSFSLQDNYISSLVSILFSCAQPWLILIIIPFFRYRIICCRAPPIQSKTSINSVTVIPVTKI